MQFRIPLRHHIEQMTPDEFYQCVPRERLQAAVLDTPSPCYLFFESIVVNQAQKLRASLERIQVHYAVKANPHPAILLAMRRLGLGADVASGHELQAVLDAGFDPARIEFSGPGKTAAELEQALGARIGSINVESLGELDALAALSRRFGLRPRIGLRVNPSIEAKSGLKMAGATQFGLSEEDLEIALAAMQPASFPLDFVGLHLHVGSQILDSGSVLEIFRVALDVAQRVARRTGRPLSKLNFGGGFGVTYFPGQEQLDLTAVGSKLAVLLGEHSSSGSGIEDAMLIIEPGRYLVAEAGVYVTRILYRKTTRGREFAIVDGGMHHNYLLAGGMGQVLRRNFFFDVLTPGGHAVPAPSYKLNVAGCLCSPQDLLLQDAPCPQRAHPGDWVVFFNCGAYGSSASPVNFLGHPKPTEILM